MDWSHVTWRKASYTGNHGGNCVEVGLWRKASHSGSNGGDCIEATRLGPLVGVRDSKHPDGPKLAFTPREWTTFTSDIKSGRYDCS